MKRFSILLSLALAALTLLAVGTPAHAGERPIHAEGRGNLRAIEFYTPLLAGPGKSQHLGGCYLFIFLNYAEVFWYGNIVPTELVLGASNGDNLFATVDSEFDPETGIVAGTITFAGGTGRFADATGSASLLIVPDTYWFVDVEGYPYPVHGTRFSWALEGTIDY